ARSGETAQWVKLPAAMCTRDTMETFTRTPGTVGRSTIMEAGILRISPSRTGKERKVASNGREAKAISNGRQRRAAPIDRGRAAIAGPVKAALTGQVLIRKGKIWTAKLRIGLVAIFQASAPRIFSAAAGLAAAVGADAEN